VNHVFEADIRSYFTRISHQWLRKMVVLARNDVKKRLSRGWGERDRDGISI
jgi:hypothetical protein